MAVSPISPLGVHHIAIQCRDLAGMVRFYEKVLRLRVERRWQSELEVDRGADRSVWFRAGNSALERCDGEPRPPPWQSDQPGLHLLALEIPWQNRAIWLAWLQYSGAEVVFESAWTVYVRDPEGNRIGLSHFPFTAEGLRSA
jgi:catechol 2,3-dioxygenase-like lactoylglutathione lyase family enzyme